MEPSDSSGWGLGSKGGGGRGSGGVWGGVGVVGVKGKLEEMVFCLFDCYLLLCRNVHDDLLFVLSRHIVKENCVYKIFPAFLCVDLFLFFFVLLNFYCVEGK